MGGEMPKVLDVFEFPHGGRKGLEYDFNSLLDGQIYQLTVGDGKNDDIPTDVTPETFLGALSRFANAKGMRVNKHVSEDGKTVTIRVRPKTVKPEETPAETPAETEAEPAAV